MEAVEDMGAEGRYAGDLFFFRWNGMVEVMDGRQDDGWNCGVMEGMETLPRLFDFEKGS